MSEHDAGRAGAIGGLHEACFGVPDLELAAAYWAAFGFHEIARGALGADEAFELYGVRSAVESVRLGHLDSDHGLVRLMRWERPTGGGIGLAPLRGHGSRWVGQFVRSALDVANHGALARRAGWPLAEIAPSFIDLSTYNPALFGGRTPEAFRDRLVAVREYTLLQPLWRQAFLERFHYDSPLLGRIDDGALLRASQVVNGSFMIASDDPDVFAFYARVLGLREAPVMEVPYSQAMASRGVFDLRETDLHWCHTFEDPRSGATAESRRSGRLYLFRFPRSSALPDRLALAQPGQLGNTLYTWRVRALDRFRAACAPGGCSAVGATVQDEFGTPAFGATTPDGMRWAFQQATGAELARLSS